MLVVMVVHHHLVHLFLLVEVVEVVKKHLTHTKQEMMVVLVEVL